MQFDWDDAKRRQNIAKHGVDFGVIKDFDWATAVIHEDGRLHYGEIRFLAYGLISKRLYACVYTERNALFRIISLRKANQREEIIYEEETNSSPD